MKNIIDIQQFQQVINLEFIARKVVEGFITGLHKSPYHGFSVEFAEHRVYNKGESTRHIDWKLFARTEKLFTKRYEEETNLRCQVVIDTSSSMLFPFKEGDIQNKLFFSIYSAAALINLMRKQRDAVGLTLFSDVIELHTDNKTSFTHTQRLFCELEKLLEPEVKPPQKKTKASEVLHHIAEKMHKRSLVIIFSDMMTDEDPEEFFSALQHLRYKKHEVVLFHVTDKKREEAFDYTNRPYKFVDLETGEEMKLNPNDVRDSYTKSINDYFNEIRLKCGQYHIDLVEADINSNFDEVLLPYLIKRKKLY